MPSSECSASERHGVLRIVDASFNRGAEGLRVMEEYARFILQDRHLSRLVKQVRHDLGEIAQSLGSRDLHVARETRQDVGTEISVATERDRASPWEVCAAGCKRVEQSLRCLEEYGKLLDEAVAHHCESLRYRVYTIERLLDLTRTNVERFARVRLYVLTDGESSQERFRHRVESLLAAGIDALQLRDKRLSDRDLLERARSLVEIARDHGALAIVNDRPDIAAAAQADGVHLGQEDLRVLDARLILGPGRVVGVSTHSMEQARRGVLDGADYLGAGPTFPSHTKQFEEFPGIHYLSQVAAEIRLPTFAIGGIHSGNLPQVLQTGVTRIAIGSSVVDAPDPAVEIRRLKELLVD